MYRHPVSKSFSADAFRAPGGEHAPIYSWVWNAKLSHEQTDAQLDEMQRLGIRAFYIIPEPTYFRPTSMPTELEPDYLTPEYFAQYEYAIRSAAARGMHCWLYDEGGWPSGGACGKVLAAHPETNKQLLHYATHTYAAGQTLAYHHENAIAAFAGTKQLASGYVFERETSVVEYYTEGVTKFGPSGPLWPDYPDLTRKDATEYFIDMTHEGYRRVLEDTFGDHVSAMFTDEPKSPGQAICYRELMQDFEVQSGYSIVPYLPFIAGVEEPDEQGAQALREWYDFCAQRFCDAFLNTCRQWCHEHNLLFTGHMDQDHIPDGCTTGGGCSYHLMRTLRCLDIPGVDVIWRQIYPGQEKTMPTGERIAQNGFFPRYASSAMAQIGGSYAMSESFAVYGNGLTYALMRHCLGYQAVRGINIFNMMLISYGRHGYMQAGEQPFFHEQLPYFADLALLNRYAERLSYVASVGERVCDTALYYPVADFWVSSRSNTVSRAFDALGRALEDGGIDFDIVDDDVLAEARGIDQGQIRMGNAVYTKLVVLPEAYLSEKTRAILARFCAGGGSVLHAADELHPAVQLRGAHEKVRVMQRRLENGELYCLFNEHTEAADFSLQVQQGNAYRLDLESGAICACKVCEHGVHVAQQSGETTVILVTDQCFDVQRVPSGACKTIEPAHYTLCPKSSFTFGEAGICELIADKAPVPVTLGAWEDYLGKEFSGNAVYKTDFACEHPEQTGACVLEIGEVQYTCEVLVNGVSVGTRLMAPYSYEIPVALLKSQNVLQLRVTNTPANQYVHTDFFDRYQPWQLSPYYVKEKAFMQDSAKGGLIGPVKIHFFDA